MIENSFKTSLTACNYSYMQLGLMDYNARFYSPTLGRFIQPDTIIPDLTNSQAWNRYVYVRNSPIRYSDPTGHWWCEGDTDCDKWVQYTLDALEQGGTHSQETFDTFNKLDSQKDVKVNFKSRGIGMSTLVPYFIDENGNISIGQQITVKGTTWSSGKLPNNGIIALFAHEISHLSQDPIVAGSVVGELEAYEVQYQVTLELGGSILKGSTLADIHKFYDSHDIYNLTDEEMDIARKLIKKQCSTCGYSAIPGNPAGIKPPPPLSGGAGPSNIRHLFE